MRGLLGCLSNVRVSMLEIYNDECRDLLHPEIPSRDIALREDKEGRMFFTGAREEIVTDKKVFAWKLAWIFVVCVNIVLFEHTVCLNSI
jgi:hypothetical protein